MVSVMFDSPRQPCQYFRNSVAIRTRIRTLYHSVCHPYIQICTRSFPVSDVSRSVCVIFQCVMRTYIRTHYLLACHQYMYPYLLSFSMSSVDVSVRVIFQRAIRISRPVHAIFQRVIHTRIRRRYLSACHAYIRISRRLSGRTIAVRLFVRHDTYSWDVVKGFRV